MFFGCFKPQFQFYKKLTSVVVTSLGILLPIINQKKMQKYYLLKPTNLNLEYLVNKYEPNFKFNYEFAYFFIHILVSYRKFNKKKTKNFNEISSKSLQSLCKDYKKHIKFLYEKFPCDGGVIWKNNYKVGHCFGYKLAPYYEQSQLEIIELEYSIFVKKIFLKYSKIKTSETFRINYHFLKRSFSTIDLTISNYQEAIHEINLKPSEKKRLRNAKSLTDILNGRYSFSLKTKTDGRVHTIITRLSKKIRKYLRYKGEPLAEVDISSAVPYFLYITINYYLNNNLSYIKDNFQYNKNSIPIIYMLEEISLRPDKYEVERFGESVINGEIYELFGSLLFNQNLYEEHNIDFSKVLKYLNNKFKEKFGHKFDGDLIELRKFAKSRLLIMLFDGSSRCKFEQIAFSSKYPSVLKFVNEFKDVQKLKQGLENIWSKSDRHKKLSYFFFQFEAKIMIDKIAREYNNLKKCKVPIFTLHDCIITTESEVEELKEFMDDMFIKLLEVKPNLSISYYNKIELQSA